jgi:hypothetical protein
LSYAVLDIELANEVEDTPEGWEAARKGELGVSVACVYLVPDQAPTRFYLFDPTGLDDACDLLESTDCVVGFNTTEFDLPALYGHLQRPFEYATRGPMQYDILQEVWQALGGKRKGYRLRDLTSRTLGIEKDSLSASPPALYKNGELGKLYTYCLWDVDITARLFDHILGTGYVIDTDGQELRLNPLPTQLAEKVLWGSL